jgi:hypothetical protein
MSDRQALQGFSSRSKGSLHKKNQLTYTLAVPAGIREVKVAFNFISEHIV